MRVINYKKYKMPRLRHHSDPALYLPLRQQKLIKGYYPPVQERLDWNEIFQDGKPPGLLDIGCGMGKFMLELAISNDGTNVLGLELRKRAVEWINSVIEGEKLPNVRAVWYSVVNGIQFIEDATIEKVFYLFPDPWIKKRHNKRRAFGNYFLEEVSRVLKPDGSFYLMTDVEEVAEVQLRLIDENGLFDARIVSESDWDINIKTNQEDFCISKNIPYTRILCKKR